MKTPRLYQPLIGHIFTFLLIVLAAGCGGGGGSENTLPNNALATRVSVHADAGLIVAVRVGKLATLDGSGSSTNSSYPLNYDWSFTSKPDTSKAKLQNPTSVNPSFIADVRGTYMVQLVVNAGGVYSQRAIASVEATNDNEPLTGKRIHTKYASHCGDCHDGRYAVPGDFPFDPVPAKSGNHLATTNMCEACHTTVGFNVFRYTDHVEVFGNCSGCHNGILAIGKSDTHIVTNAECNDCHSTTSFLMVGPDGQYDHTGITSGCSTCHNGRIAIGKHELHMFTETDCHFCHTTTTFQSSYPDHSGPEVVGKRCDSCHNGDIEGVRGPIVDHPTFDTSIDCNVCHSINNFNMGGVFDHRLIVPPIQCADCHNDTNSINATGLSPNHAPTLLKDCGVCHAVGDSFANGIYDHTGIVNNCTECHGVGGNGTGLGKSVNHMPTDLDCSDCHTTSTFTTGVFNHDLSVYNPPLICNDCHNNVISVGKLDTHIATIPDDRNCGDCHGTDTFAGAVFDHSGVTSNCASCHNGTISTGKHRNHMMTNRDCSECHMPNDFTTFTMTVFNHLDINNNSCASCHDGVIAKGKDINHIPALAECSQCHTDTSVNGFVSPLYFLNNVHGALTGGCEGCHTSRFIPTKPLVKATGHLPTDQDCHFCHTNTNFAERNFNHTGITGNCESCHDGNYFDSAGALGKANDPTPPHPATTADCGVCHGIGANFRDGVFDHTGRTSNCAECHGDGMPGAVTKKNPGHVVTTEDCSVCHVPGSFATAVFNHTGITSNCASCHDGTAATATVKSVNHLPTADDCSVCHNTTAFAGAKYDHQGVTSGCAVCHDGIIAKGKLTNHVPTNDDCSQCHQTTGFIPATFDHTGITGNCVSCHNSVFARGKEAGHVLTDADCGLCHTTRGFIPAIMDHSTVTASTRCDSCHGVTATGMDAKTNPPHLATNLDCRACHTTTTFVGGSWVHDASTAGTCDTCHTTGGGATPKPTPAQGHFDTTEQCDACHNTNAWAPINFTHSSTDYPGDHRRNPACISCHSDNRQQVTYPFPFDNANPPQTLIPDCAACHADKFEPEDKHKGGTSGTVQQNKDCSDGRCHKVTDGNFG